MPVTSTQRTSVSQDFLPLSGTDHVELYVGNAKQAAHFYRSAFGMETGRLLRAGNGHARASLLRAEARQPSASS